MGRRRPWTSGFNIPEFGAALAGPGMDTRQWASHGLVDQETPDAHSVTFDPSLGPLVNVTLQPSNIPVVCRVANGVAGNQEGEWFPFLPGDEVQVIVNEGNERAGCIIVGRLNNEIDAWPRLVAGQDPTKNTFGFRRLRTPYIIETASSFMIRSALTGANLTIDQKGNLFLVSGDGHRFVMNADAMQLGEAGGDTFFQIDMDAKEALIQVNSAAQFLFSDKNTQFSTPGQMQIITNGVQYTQHAITYEQVIGLLVNYFVMLKNLGAFAGGPAIPSPALLVTPELLAAGMVAMLNGMNNPVPFVPGVPLTVPTGNYSTLPALYGLTGAVTQALGGQTIAAADVTGFIPGTARTSFLY